MVDVFANPKDLGYVIPEEGATMYQEDICVLKTAPNKENAIKFMQFYTRPEVAALNIEQQTNGTANVPARQLTPSRSRIARKSIRRRKPCRNCRSSKISALPCASSIGSGPR